MRNAENSNTPMFQAHGTDDSVVNFKFGEMSYKLMKELGVEVKFHKYEGMGHEASNDELSDIFDWIKERLPEETQHNE